MPITPDTKDWTWVLERACPECGLDVRALSRQQLVAMLRDNAVTWAELLHDTHVRRRPSDDVWSALEYGCHVRDVYRLFDQRLQLMLDQEHPTFANWDQDETAVQERYDQQDPKVVAQELRSAAETLGGRFAALSEHQWGRTGARTDGARFTVDSFGRYLLHDIVHHVDDVRRGFAHLGG